MRVRRKSNLIRIYDGRTFRRQCVNVIDTMRGHFIFKMSCCRTQLTVTTSFEHGDFISWTAFITHRLKVFTSDGFFYISLTNVLHSHWDFLLPQVHTGNAWFRNTALHTFIHSPENYYPDPLVPWPTQIVSAELIFGAAINRPARAKWWLFLKLLIYSHAKQKSRRTPEGHRGAHFMIQTLPWTPIMQLFTDFWSHFY